jgi:hypothetical protein
MRTGVRPASRYQTRSWFGAGQRQGGRFGLIRPEARRADGIVWSRRLNAEGQAFDCSRVRWALERP